MNRDASGQPGHPCPGIQADLGAFLDGEVVLARSEEIRIHLADCPPCLAQVRVEATVRGLLRRSCAPPPAPEELRIRVVARIRQVRVVFEADDTPGTTPGP